MLTTFGAVQVMASFRHGHQTDIGISTDNTVSLGYHCMNESEKKQLPSTSCLRPGAISRRGICSVPTRRQEMNGKLDMVACNVEK